jgi:phosphate butyryltransferase
MEYRDFNEILEKARNARSETPMVVAAAEDGHTLEAVTKAFKEKIVRPYLVGDKEKILSILEVLGESLPEELIIDRKDPNDAAVESVRLVREGQCSFIMKGLLETSQILKAILNKENGLGTGRVISHMTVTHIPSYHKLLAITDAAILINPDLSQKKDIIQNAVNGFISMGYHRPKVAVLAAVEKVNPKMPETIDAFELKLMAQKGEITGCLVEGPISADLALNKESARIKGYESEVTGDPDILVMPNITAGNILSKSLREFADTTSVGVVLGARVPMVLTSRGASTRSKYTSVVVVSEMAKGGEMNPEDIETKLTLYGFSGFKA